MSVIAVRTIIIYATLILTMRLMGKRQIGEMQPFEFIITLIIADLACIPMADTSIPLLYGIVAIITIFILHQIMALIEKKGNLSRKIISGKPSIVINKEGVSIKELKRDNLDIDDLMESMRSLGYFSFDEIDYAIFESNGKLSVLENSNTQKTNNNSLPVIIVKDGTFNKKNLDFIKYTEEKILQLAGVKNKKYLEVFTVDACGKVYCKIKNRHYKTFNINLQKEVTW